MAWTALIVAGGLFVPYVPYAIGQSQQMIYGQWLDYLGPRYNYPLAVKAGTGLAAGRMVITVAGGSSASSLPRATGGGRLTARAKKPTT